MVNTINVTMNMNAMQIAMCANAICESKWTLRLDDIQLCLERGVMGQYGELFNRMDQMVVFEWFRKYEIERSQEIAKKRDANHANNIYEVWQSPVLNNILHEVTSKLTHREIVKEEYKPREKNAGELWAAEVQRDFDELYRQNGNDSLPRMIAYNGKWMDQTEYYQTRFDEAQTIEQ